MSFNQKRDLTIDEKYQILQMLESGVCYKVIIKKYGISVHTIRRIKKREVEIRKFYETNSAAANRSTEYLKSLASADVERFLYQWYIRCRDKNTRITGPMLCEKAQECYAKLQRHHNFKANMYWLTRFRLRHRICKADIIEDYRVPNETAADTFKADFTKLLVQEGYTLENIYTADNTALMWRAIPKQTSFFYHEKLIARQKRIEDRVTVLLCANATGCHKLPVLIIGTFAETGNLSNFNMRPLPVIYKAKSSGLMDRKTFNDWIEKCFIKSVKKRQLGNGRREKTLLLLDNAGWDLHSGIQSTKDEFVKIMYIPFDAAPLIQPMDTGIIACFKRLYRKELLETLMPLPDRNTEKEVIDNHEKLTMWDCRRIIKDAWLHVNNAILKNAWYKLLKHESEERAKDIKIIKKDIEEAIEILDTLPGCEKCDSVAVLNWFEIDKKYNTDVHIDTNDIFNEFLNEAVSGGENTIDEDIFRDILYDMD